MFTGVRDGRWRWTAATPSARASSPGVTREFCAACGAALTFRSTNMSNILHFHTCAFDNPVPFTPERHVAVEEAVCWLTLADDAPRRTGPRV